MKMKGFKNIEEFAENKTINKLIYADMDNISRRELKFYIYKVLEDKQEKKDIIWEYLNEPIDSEAYLYSSIMLGQYLRRKK